ncbi:hypothetical protein HDU86_001330 [Geranomyces michiganensis]|nr:hypothetical protein HDU86_001330 [Geranomyces michiganensis]
MNTNTFIQQFLADNRTNPLLDALPGANEPHVRQCLSLFLGAQKMFGIQTPLAGTITDLAKNCFNDAEMVVHLLHELYADIDREVQRFQKVVGNTPLSTPSHSPCGTPPLNSPRSLRQAALQRDQSISSVSVFPAYPFSRQRTYAPADRENFREKILVRDQYRCKVTGRLDFNSIDAKLVVPGEDDEETPAEAAHIFPFGLRYHVPFLSSMVYPIEFFLFMEQGKQINSTENGLLLDASLHRLFGQVWCIQAEQSQYKVLMLGRRDFSNKQIKFPSPIARPAPILINLHGCFALAAAAWRSADLWAAEGERNLGIVDDCDDKGDTMVRADSNEILGEQITARFLSKYGAGSGGEIETLVLGEPAI